MAKITTIGLDSAKSVFHVVGCDARGKVVRKLRRGQVLGYFANLARCRVALANKLARIGWAVLAHDTVYRAG